MVEALYAVLGAGGGVFVGVALGYLLARRGVRPPLPEALAEALTGHQHEWHILGKVRGTVKYECHAPLGDGQRCAATAWEHEVKRG